MSDPSDRFAETLTCGCEWHAGVLFPCAQHRAATAPTTGSPTGALLEMAWGVIANA